MFLGLSLLNFTSELERIAHPLKLLSFKKYTKVQLFSVKINQYSEPVHKTVLNGTLRLLIYSGDQN